MFFLFGFCSYHVSARRLRRTRDSRLERRFGFGISRVLYIIQHIIDPTHARTRLSQRNPMQTNTLPKRHHLASRKAKETTPMPIHPCLTRQRTSQMPAREPLSHQPPMPRTPLPLTPCSPASFTADIFALVPQKNAVAFFVLVGKRMQKGDHVLITRRWNAKGKRKERPGCCPIGLISERE